MAELQTEHQEMLEALERAQAMVRFSEGSPICLASEAGQQAGC